MGGRVRPGECRRESRRARGAAAAGVPLVPAVVERARRARLESARVCRAARHRVPAPVKLSPRELAARLDRILDRTGRLCRRCRSPRWPTSRRTATAICAISASMSSACRWPSPTGWTWASTPKAGSRKRRPWTWSDGASIARYGALVRGRLAGWFEGAGESEYARTIAVYYGPQSGHDLLERTTWHAAQHLRQLHVVTEGLGLHPPIRCPTSPACRCRPASGERSTHPVSLIPKSEFVGLDGVAHLCTGGEAPWLRSHDAACRALRPAQERGHGRPRGDLRASTRAPRSACRALLGVDPERIAFLAHASEGLNQAVPPWTGAPATTAVVADLEYPSLVFPPPPARARRRGARGAHADHYLSIDALAAAVDRRTRLLLVSHVSYLTGQRLDLARCAEIARGTAPGSPWTRPTRSAWRRCRASSATSSCPPATSGCSPPTASASSPTTPTASASSRPRPRLAQRGAPRRLRGLRWRCRCGRTAARLEAGNPSLLRLFVLDNALERARGLDPAAVLAHAQALGARSSRASARVAAT